MPDLLTPERLAELREWLSKATPGPWDLWTSNSWRRFGSPATGQTVCEPVVHPGDGCPDLLFRNGGEDGPDATLMRDAPQIIPALLSHIDAMREVLEEVEWAGGESGYECAEPCCPACGEGSHARPTHAPDCRLAAALGKGVGDA